LFQSLHVGNPETQILGFSRVRVRVKVKVKVKVRVMVRV